MAMPISVTSGQPQPPGLPGLPAPAGYPAGGGRGRAGLGRLVTAIRRNRKATAGAALLLLFALIALFPGLIPHYSPTEIFFGPKCPSCYSGRPWCRAPRRRRTGSAPTWRGTTCSPR